ncbi:MAG: response regulator [Gammaproteobacteria bacterium]|nr:response regulator [Gammaproteobacteria bacterium]
MNRVLLIEDEEVILKALTRLLERNHFVVTGVTSVERAEQLDLESFDIILADLRLPGAEGTSIIPQAGPVPVVIMTSHASVRSAVNAMQVGAIDYISKPFDHDELLLVLERSLKQNQLQKQNRALNHDIQRLVSHQAFDHCPSLRAKLDTMRETLANTRYVHLHGEPGSGREILARDIHKALSNSDSPLVVVDASTLARGGSNLSVLEDGHANMPNGFLRGASGGTLVVRYIEVLDQDSQKQLWQTLSQSNEPRSARAHDLRFISISDIPVQTLADQQLLIPELATLFVRNEITIAPLVERPEDIESLSAHLLARYASLYQREALHFSVAAQAAINAYAWPGNMNELRCVIERGVLLAKGSSVEPVDMGFGALESATPAGPDQHLSLDEYFRYFVLRHQESLSETELAGRLGISRKALWERRQKMQLLRN